MMGNNLWISSLMCHIINASSGCVLIVFLQCRNGPRSTVSSPWPGRCEGLCVWWCAQLHPWQYSWGIPSRAPCEPQQCVVGKTHVESGEEVTLWLSTDVASRMPHELLALWLQPGEQALALPAWGGPVALRCAVTRQPGSPGRSHGLSPAQRGSRSALLSAPAEGCASRDGGEVRVLHPGHRNRRPGPEQHRVPAAAGGEGGQEGGGRAGTGGAGGSGARQRRRPAEFSAAPLSGPAGRSGRQRRRGWHGHRYRGREVAVARRGWRGPWHLCPASRARPAPGGDRA